MNYQCSFNSNFKSEHSQALPDFVSDSFDLPAGLEGEREFADLQKFASQNLGPVCECLINLAPFINLVSFRWTQEFGRV